MPVVSEASMRDPNVTITPIQLELVAAIASGLTQREIAEQKFMHYKTVAYQLSQAMERTEAMSLTDLAICCVRAGLIVRNGTGYIVSQPERAVS